MENSVRDKNVRGDRDNNVRGDRDTWIYYHHI